MLQIKLPIFLLGAALIAGAGASQAASGAALPKIVVRANASVDTDSITLGEIADITPSPLKSKMSARIAATVVGTSPLPGETRPLDRGDIMLKLRQAGIDPNTVDLEGADNITVASQSAVGTPAPAVSGSVAAASSAPAVSPAPNPHAVKPGDPVDVVLVNGPVTVRAKAFAVSGGAVGDTVTIRRDESDHLLGAIIIGADEVQLEE